MSETELMSMRWLVIFSVDFLTQHNRPEKQQLHMYINVLAVHDMLVHVLFFSQDTLGLEKCPDYRGVLISEVS